MLPTHRVTTHPGEMLLEEFLKPLDLSVTKFAEAIGVSRIRLSELVNGRRGVTADTALRLAKALGTSPEFWLNLQSSYDLTEARAKTKLGPVRVVNPAAVARAKGKPRPTRPAGSKNKPAAAAR